jgi:hypothetical protein
MTAVVLGGAYVRTCFMVYCFYVSVKDYALCTVFAYLNSTKLQSDISIDRCTSWTVVASGCHAREKIKLSIIKKKTSFEDNNIAECSRGHSPAGKMAKGGLHCWDSIGQEGDVFLHSVGCLYRLWDSTGFPSDGYQAAVLVYKSERHVSFNSVLWLYSVSCYVVSVVD